ncbi:MAG: peptidase M19 [Gammaproteobacteria bacterium]|nr:MAG: peptidase M19 [Gammaproteobacteria bacterium]
MTATVFDGHNDILTQLMEAGGVDSALQFGTRGGFHVDAVKAREGGLGGGLFAIWVPSASDEGCLLQMETVGGYDLPLPPPVEPSRAMAVVAEQFAILARLEAANEIVICTRADELEPAFRGETLAVVVHMEGAEALDPDLHLLDLLHHAGLRSLGPVWSRPNRFGDGVPFRFPADPDIGGGLTADGIRLVRRCDELGILVDLSHINLKGFEDVATHSSRPLVATHSNAHALCEHARNLTDDQLRVIAQTRGLVGLNFATAFLRADGRMLADVPLTTLLRHLDHLLGVLGEGGVALGSDYDGAVPPAAIADASKLPVLIAAMREHGYGEALIERICFRNWFDVLERSWRSHPFSISSAPG